jgi:hypothetical protein
MCRKTALLLTGLVLCLSSVGHAVTIEWVNNYYDQDANGIPDDQGWVDLLRAQGYTVNVRATSTTGTYWHNGATDIALTAEMLGYLNAADLVIISRCADSTNFANGDVERNSWNGLTKPVLSIGAPVIQNNRLRWLNNGTQTYLAGTTVLEAVVPTHPIFTGVPLDASNQVAIIDTAIGYRAADPTRALTVLATTSAGNGTLLGRVVGATQYVWIAEWAAGRAFYDGTTGNTPGGKRLLFCAGTREYTTAGSLLGRGMCNLNATGRKMFLNSVRYMLGLPMVEGTASVPSPADKATDIGRDVVLAWRPGPFAATHNVYFGTSLNDVNNASVNDPRGVLVAQGQDANTFDPVGSLRLGQTYYWRIDEVNAPPTSSTMFKGSVWSFMIEPVGYKIATANITATASGSDPNRGPDKTIDGSGLDAADQHSTDLMQMWNTAGVAAPVWVQYDFDRPYKLYEMWVWNHNTEFESMLGFGLKNVTVEYSADGSQWTPLGDFVFAQAPGQASYAHNTTVSFHGVVAQHVKITATTNWGGQQSGLSEVRFYYIPVLAREPRPAGGAAGLSPDVTLSWRAGREAVSHNVYFGTDANALTLAGTVVPSSFTPAVVNLGMTYYWRIDEVNSAETPSVWAGNVWSLSTREYAVIDDMESYDDKDGTTVFNTWLDGYLTTTNGAQVGLDAPANGTFCERTIVHGGRQSMPLKYNNATANYSEADRTWGTDQNWKVNGANTVSLWFRGTPTGFVQLASDHILMNGMGTDIYNAADQGRFVYKQLTGNGTLIARVDRLDAVDPWSKAAVMIRQSLDAGSTFAMSVLGASNGMRLQYRLTTGGNAGSDSTPATQAQKDVRAPVWLKIERIGTTFNAYYATTDAPTTWIASPQNPQTITMTDPVYIGLACTSHVAATATQAEFSAIATTGNVTGQWQSADLGIAQPAGNTLETFYVTLKDSAGKSVTIKHPDTTAVGAGVWQQWKIPLSSLTPVDASRVRTMIIGVGDRTNPKHGSGWIYIDDIGFGHPAQ